MVTVKIEGMSCDHCVRAVTRALEKVPGVVRVLEVNVARGQAVVEGHPAPEAIAKAIEEAGYVATTEPRA
jgi:copper chaperone